MNVSGKASCLIEAEEAAREATADLKKQDFFYLGIDDESCEEWVHYFLPLSRQLITDEPSAIRFDRCQNDIGERFEIYQEVESMDVGSSCEGVDWMCDEEDPFDPKIQTQLLDLYKSFLVGEGLSDPDQEYIRVTSKK